MYIFPLGDHDQDSVFVLLLNSYLSHRVEMHNMVVDELGGENALAGLFTKSIEANGYDYCLKLFRQIDNLLNGKQPHIPNLLERLFMFELIYGIDD